MPELPEVEAIRIIVEKAMKKKKIIEVHAPNDTMIFDRGTAAQFKKKITGSTVTGSDRRGKYFWLKLNHKPWPIFHLGMTGSFEVYASEKELPKKTPRSLRVEFKLSDGGIIWFKDPRRFGRVRLSDDPLNEKSIAALGFDPLFEFPSAKALHEILSKRKAPIKAVLLDQSIFAGVGNWIADEVLFQARFSPFRAARSLTLKEVTTLRSAILKVIKKAVSVSANADDFPKTWLFHHRWGKSKNARVFSGHAIRHVTIGGRTAAWVPDLQK
jgi:formamidopyrimidine-DNA glycosylase